MSLFITRDFLRVSELAKCRLQIAHRVAGTLGSDRSGGTMAMKMGSAMEPVINGEMEEHGALVYFGGNDQITLGVDKPPVKGHPDGYIVWGPTGPNAWLRKNIPASALARLDRGEALLWEVKTMNDASWKSFVSRGLYGNQLLRQYLTQIAVYLTLTLGKAGDEARYEERDPITGEASERIFSLREWFQHAEYQYPMGVLVVGFNTAIKRFAFAYYDLDDLADVAREAFDRAEGLANLLEQDQWPAPDYDGRSTECYFCPVRSLCPAATGSGLDDNLDDLSVEMTPSIDMTELEVQLAQYAELSEVAKEAEAARKTAAEELKTLLGEAGITKQVVGNWKVARSEARGRESINMQALQFLINSLPEEYRFAVPYSRGEGSVRLRVVPAAAPDGADSD